MAFNGTCHQCGQRRHKEAVCYAKKAHQQSSLNSKRRREISKEQQPESEQQQQHKIQETTTTKSNFQRTCNYCRKIGHKEIDCLKKVADLKEGTTNNEAAAASITNRVEFLLMAQECQKQGFPDNHKLLNMTSHATGMVGVKKSAETVSIVMGNIQGKPSFAIREIPGVICNNQGKQILPVKITNVALVPDCAFNLFSISKRLKQGWSLGGSAHTLELISPNGKN